MSLVRANLLDLREDLDDFEMGLSYKTPTELESLEKRRKTLKKSSEG